MKYTDIPEQYKKLRDAIRDALSYDEEIVTIVRQDNFDNGFITAVTKSETGVITIMQADRFINDCNTIYIDSTVIDAIKKAALGTATKRV